ncbi:MAG: hypothetical protein ACLQC7_00365 [Thermoplasmata archaeon]
MTVAPPALAGDGSPPSTLGYNRAGALTKFLGTALLGISLILVGLALNASYSNDFQATQTDFILTFIIGGLGVIVLGLGFLFAAMNRA